MEAKLGRRIVEFVKLALLSLLGGIALGTSLAMYDLDVFSPLPGPITFLTPLIVGVSIGALAPTLQRALIVMFVAIIIYGAVDIFSLSYPEFGRLGELGIEFSALKAVLNGFVYVIPLTLIGLILGKSLFGGD